MRRGSGMLHNCFCDRPCFYEVSPGHPTIVDPIGNMPEPQPSCMRIHARAWKNQEPVIVELVIRYRDKRVVATTIMPSKHRVGCAAGFHQAKNAFDVCRGAFACLFVGHLYGFCKEVGWRHLLTITNHNCLCSTGNSPESFWCWNLTGLIKYHQIKAEPALRQVRCH